MIDCRFEDEQAGTWKVVSFFAKRARGRFARWAIEQRIARPQDLAGFAQDGYFYDSTVSKPEHLVFRRHA